MKINRFLLFLLFFIMSCSTHNVTPEVLVEKNYSQETNRAFSMIENNGSYRTKKTLSPVDKTLPKPKLELNQRKNTSHALIEINQNLTFYCMKHRKDKRFGGSEKKCLDHVNLILEKCQKFYSHSNQRLLKCLKTKIKT